MPLQVGSNRRSLVHDGGRDAGGLVAQPACRGGPDWVLVLDDAARDLPPLGTLSL